MGRELVGSSESLGRRNYLVCLYILVRIIPTESSRSKLYFLLQKKDYIYKKIITNPSLLPRNHQIDWQSVSPNQLTHEDLDLDPPRPAPGLSFSSQPSSRPHHPLARTSWSGSRVRVRWSRGFTVYRREESSLWMRIYLQGKLMTRFTVIHSLFSAGISPVWPAPPSRDWASGQTCWPGPRWRESAHDLRRKGRQWLKRGPSLLLLRPHLVANVLGASFWILLSLKIPRQNCFSLLIMHYSTNVSNKKSSS